jgi:hypothetical protein
LNWFNTYRQRVCTERNWRNGNSKHTVISLPYSNDFESWYETVGFTTAVKIQHRTAEGSGITKEFAIVEPTGHSPIAHPSSNDTPHTPQPSILVELKLPNRCFYTETQMSDRFVVTLIAHFGSDISTMEIRNRGTLELRRSRPTPYHLRLKSVKGKWALLFTYHPSLGYSYRYRYAIWDLESGLECPGHIDYPKNAVCIHNVNEEYAIIHTIATNPDENGIFEWILYQFSLNEPVKQLRRGSLQIGVEESRITHIHSLDSLRILYNICSHRGYSYERIIHTIPHDEESSQTTTNCTIQSKHTVAPSLGLDHLNEDIDYSISIYWPNGIKCQHIIGNLCIITENKDDKYRYALVDISTRQLVRYLEATNEAETYAFLMTAIISLDRVNNEIQVIDYGAL